MKKFFTLKGGISMIQISDFDFQPTCAQRPNRHRAKTNFTEHLTNKVLALMFPGQKLAEEAKKDILKLITSKQENLGCVCLYKFSNDFMKICANHKLNPGTREIIITEGNKVLYSDNYMISPR